ncbi:hypothetical protein BG015_001761, partial [Linnemannia schmuckeri]
WNTMTCKDGTISWSIIQHSPSSSSPCSTSTSTTSSPQSHQIDWSSDGVAVESITTQIRTFPIPFPFGNDHSNANTEKPLMTLGDLIDRTPRDRMAKVMVDERMFETWYYCRTILIGDACHKLNPAGNQGAHLSLFDAHTLALQLAHLKTTQLKHITPAFKAHKSIRLPAAQRAWLLSRALTKLGGGGGSGGGGVGVKVLRKLPPWAWRKVFERLVGSSPRGGNVKKGGVSKILKTVGSTVSLGKEDENEDEEKVVEEAVAVVRSVNTEDDEEEEDSEYDVDDGLDDDVDNDSNDTSSQQKSTDYV